MASSEVALSVVRKGFSEISTAVRKAINNRVKLSETGCDIIDISQKSNFIIKSPFWNRFLPESLRKTRRIEFYPESKVKKSEIIIQGKIQIKRTDFDVQGKTARLETFNPNTNKRVIREYQGGTATEGGKEIAHEISFGDVVYSKKGLTKNGGFYLETYSSKDGERYTIKSAGKDNIHLAERKVQYNDGTSIVEEFDIKKSVELNPDYLPDGKSVFIEGLKKRTEFNPQKTETTVSIFDTNATYNKLLEETRTTKGIITKQIQYSGSLERGYITMHFDPKEQIRITTSRYQGPNVIIGGRKYFNQKVTEDIKTGTLTTRKEFQRKADEFFPEDMESEVVMKGDKELRYTEYNSIGWREYERITDPVTGIKTEDVYFKHIYDPSSNIFDESLKARKIFDKDGKLIEEVRFNSDGYKIFEYKDGKARKFSGKEKSSTGRNSKTSSKPGGPRPSNSIGHKKYFIEDMEKFLNGSYKNLTDDEVNYLARVMEIKEDPQLLKSLYDENNLEAKNLFRKLCIKYHPETSEDTTKITLFRIVQALHKISK